jgi:phosphatidylinositol alpha-1,6-mannosyltransferase
VLSPQDYASESEIESFNAAQPYPIVTIRHVPGALLEGAYRAVQLGRWIGRHRPTVIVASGSRSVLLAAARLRGRELPWVAVGHGTEFGPGLDDRNVLRWAFGQAAAVICVSEFTRRTMHEAGIRARAESVIHNGADPVRFHELGDPDARALRREMGLEGARILITVGNVTERKGQDLVVRALPAILRQEPGAHYIVAGLPSRGKELQELARDLGVLERVHLLGRVEAGRLTRLLNAADVFVMTSRNTTGGDVEGFGIAVVEAALCGLPAVVSGDTGLAEAVEDGVTGVVVPPEDPAATAAAILGLLGDDDGRAAMGRRARIRAEKEQTWTHCAALYAQTLARLCGEPFGDPRPPLSREKEAQRLVR